jgi:hypothetical protein
MRTNLLNRVAVFAVVAGALSTGAQEAQVRQMRAAAPGVAAKQARLPYTAEFKNTRVQTLADGSTITHESTEVMARDAQGRTLTIHTSEAGMESNVTQTSSTVYDPASRTRTSWFTPGQRLIVTTNSSTQTSTCAANATRMAPQAQAVSDPSRQDQPKPANEELGLQTFLGVEARGHRTTTTYPAGSIGNSDQLVRSYETWFSTTPGYVGINVRQINDDPQTGRSVRELTKFTPGDPDPALFQPPDGFETVNHEVHEEVRCP